MVNTFLTSPSFTESAASLDSRRCGKQRVEAKQILDLIMKYQFLGQAFSNPIPADPYKWYDWTRIILKIFKQSGCSLIIKPSISTPNTPNDYILVQSTSIPEGSRIIGMGFGSHPCILMWLGWPDALREYIDVHIEEWIKRGFTNNMTRYAVRNATRPPWTYDLDFIRRHRSMLLQKEQQRKEPPWYVNNPVFMAENSLHLKTLPFSGKDGLEISSSNQMVIPPKIYFWPFTPKTGAGDSDSAKRYTQAFTMVYYPYKPPFNA